jgi:hypothetical protein
MGVLETRLPQHLGLRRTDLRHTGATFIAIVTASLLIGPLTITIIIFGPAGASSAMAEAIDAGLTAAEVAASSVSTVFSSDTSFSSSESSKMMTLPSPGGPRMSWLRSPKSFLVNSASVMKFSHLKIRKDQSSEPSRRSRPIRTLVSRGGVRRSPTETLVVAEIQMAPAVESWRRWVKDFPLGRESSHV